MRTKPSSADASPPSVRTGLPLRVALLALLLPGCSVNVRDGAGPLVPIPNVIGQVVRAGAPAAGVKVSLRTEAGVEAATTKTNSTGRFDFANVTPGAWEVKVSGEGPGDFDSITRGFRLDAGAAPLELPAVDVHAYGAQEMDPGPDANVPDPSSHEPMMFRWTPPSVPGTSARVQVLDTSGGSLWASAKVRTDTLSWNGLADQGATQGRPVGPGEYGWRVKFALPDSTEGRLAERRFVLS